MTRHMAPPTRLFIFDADNTLRRTTVPGKPCPHGPGEWELLPGVRERLGAVRWGGEGALLGVASNQDQVAYGHLTAAMAQRLLADMVRAAVGEIAPAPCIRFCPHALEVPCACRKPAPGMLLEIMAHFGVAPAETLFVGDAQTDAEAARAAGMGFVWAWDFFGWGL
ncbi:MAG: HAD-IIIA family hydrolase [Pseudomonadota bacterium]